MRWSAHGAHVAPSLPANPARHGSLRLHLAGCDLSWVTPAAARRCLSSLGHVLFAGDSVTRLQFLSLEHFLHTGSWDPVDGGPPSDAAARYWPLPSSTEENPALDLDGYLRDVTRRMGGTEVCDCSLADAHIENRYYHEAHAEGGVQLSYVTFFSWRYPLYIHRPGWLNVSCAEGPPCAQAGCNVPHCGQHASAPADFRAFRQPAALNALPTLLAPDVMVLNAGVHDQFSRREDLAQVEGLVAAMAARRALAEAAARGGAGRNLSDAWERGIAAADAAQLLAEAAAAAAAAAAPPAAPADQTLSDGAALLKLWWGSGGLSLVSQGYSEAQEAAAVAAHRELAAAEGAGAWAARTAAPPAFVWKTTSPRKGDTRPQARVHGRLAGGARLGAEPAAPPGPWPPLEAPALAALRSGGAVFNAEALLWPLVVLGNAANSSTAFAHRIDTLHFAPAVNAELNKALLSLLCEHAEF